MHGPRYFLGQWIKRAHHHFAARAFKFAAWDRVIALLYERSEVPLDYIAFDYYDPFIAHALRWPTWHDFEVRRRSARDWVLESVASKWWGLADAAGGPRFLREAPGALRPADDHCRERDGPAPATG